MMATRNVRTKYPAYLRWVAKYIDPDVKGLIRTRRQGAELMRPVLNARLAELGFGAKRGQKTTHEDAFSGSWKNTE